MRGFVSFLAAAALIFCVGCASKTPADTPAGGNPADTAAKVAAPGTPAFNPAKERSFHFTYEATVKDVPAGKSVRVWIPVPQTTDFQTISNIKHEPADARITRESAYGNKMLFLEVPSASAATVTVKLEFDVARKTQENRLEAKGGGGARPDDPLFLASHRLAPVEGKASDLAKSAVADGDADTVKLRKVYDYVVKNTTYSKKGTGWGRGSIDWVCNEKYGNCTDFHALLISMTRSQKMPAKFEMGFPLPQDKAEGEIGGYHCWALVWVQTHGWVPVDASEAQKRVNEKNVVDYYLGTLDADRVTFTVGRDIDLEPRQSGDPLNYFIYPYVEVDGKPFDAAKVARKFTFKNL
jgi:transglutaminase-like putative cysteine protease